MSVSAPVAIVTGGARGIGLATALALAEKGYRIAVSDLDGPDLAAGIARLEAAGATILPLPGDVSAFAAVGAHAATCLDRFGRIDVLVNNAGISQPKSLIDISEDEYDRTIAVNLKSCFNWCKSVAPAMLAAGRGRIVNVSSVSANTGGARSAVSKFAYCTAKAGILGMTRALAKELAPAISVNAVCPGSIETALTSGLIAANREAITNTIPLGRIGTPEDVAVVITFLATVEPNFLTGEIIDVDGGQWVN
ncbi:SDR family NAD(P)-dependent oxidoreductase [Methylobacterium sp. EM32]|uniref:SDR family NAD(P)-dependent oxidoreductase n=1 Tax=Methylobacterium sp. EM32 TaxID=3163481 RepID=UPI0033A0AD48